MKNSNKTVQTHGCLMLGIENVDLVVPVSRGTPI